MTDYFLSLVANCLQERRACFINKIWYFGSQTNVLLLRIIFYALFSLTVSMLSGLA